MRDEVIAEKVTAKLVEERTICRTAPKKHLLQLYYRMNCFLFLLDAMQDKQGTYSPFKSCNNNICHIIPEGIMSLAHGA
jgi:hypothetical protein